MSIQDEIIEYLDRPEGDNRVYRSSGAPWIAKQLDLDLEDVEEALEELASIGVVSEGVFGWNFIPEDRRKPQKKMVESFEREIIAVRPLPKRMAQHAQRWYEVCLHCGHTVEVRAERVMGKTYPPMVGQITICHECKRGS